MISIVDRSTTPDLLKVANAPYGHHRPSIAIVRVTIFTHRAEVANTTNVYQRILAEGETGCLCIPATFLVHHEVCRQRAGHKR